MRIPPTIEIKIAVELARLDRPDNTFDTIDAEKVAAWLYLWHPVQRLDVMDDAEFRTEVEQAVRCIDAEPDTTARLIATY